MARASFQRGPASGSAGSGAGAEAASASADQVVEQGVGQALSSSPGPRHAIPPTSTTAEEKEDIASKVEGIASMVEIGVCPVLDLAIPFLHALLVQNSIFFIRIDSPLSPSTMVVSSRWQR